MFKKLLLTLTCVCMLLTFGSTKSQSADLFHITYVEGWGETVDFQLAWWWAPDTIPTLMQLYKLVVTQQGCTPTVVSIGSALQDNVTYIWRVYYKYGFVMDYSTPTFDPNYFSVVSRWNSNEGSWDHGVLPVPSNESEGESVIGVDYRIRASYDSSSGNTYLAAYLYNVLWETTTNLPESHNNINTGLGNPCVAQ